MKNILLIIITTVFIYSCNTAQDKDCKKSFLIVNYNVENLFDTIHDAGKYDEDFTPEGKKNWNSKRYNNKLQKLAYVIQQIDKEKLPDVVGLVEIENKRVLKDLVSQKEIKGAKYNIVHHEGPDVRGIDCALLYNPNTFSVLKSTFYRVNMENNPNFKTREIIYVKGKVNKANDEVHIFVNHWPSRRGGMEKSAPKRALAAEVLRNSIDSILATDAMAKIIIMGDFNDETDNKSITEVLGANNNKDSKTLYNTSATQDDKNIGSYHYWKTGEWNMLDQMIISNGLLNATTGIQTLNTEMQIFRPEWLLHKDKDGNKSPSKTYGKGYYGGYSDHLPIYKHFKFNCK
ncbi:MAG: endonuclease/exonuclease/phosphatase family protein [Bacteroidetes bacterium]|nr:MAG: endonuclease/exonuclease/phosphatase family protein [Bacteroidota bacterium]